MILEQLAAAARERMQRDRAAVPEDCLPPAPPRPAFCFEQALQGRDMAFICEIKKASPSKGVIDPVFDYCAIAQAYTAAGADCISCLTEPRWFLGSDEIFRQVRRVTPLPMIRKDFTVDPYQIAQAKSMGADAVLLICALLDTDTLRDFIARCDALGMSALVEAHDEAELTSAVQAGARLIGVNNRNLKDFSVDIGNATRLRALAPAGVTFVAESGISSPADVARLRQSGADAALVGEYLMRSSDRAATLAAMRQAVAACD